MIKDIQEVIAKIKKYLIDRGYNIDHLYFESRYWCDDEPAFLTFNVIYQSIEFANGFRQWRTALNFIFDGARYINEIDWDYEIKQSKDIKTLCEFLNFNKELYKIKGND